MSLCVVSGVVDLKSHTLLLKCSILKLILSVLMLLELSIVIMRIQRANSEARIREEELIFSVTGGIKQLFFINI